MTQSNTTTALAFAFAQQLREQLTEEEFAAVRHRNRLEALSACHSHDFCDANMVMFEAFTVVMGREMDLESDEDVALFNAAWALAKDKFLTEA